MIKKIIEIVISRTLLLITILFPFLSDTNYINICFLKTKDNEGSILFGKIIVTLICIIIAFLSFCLQTLFQRKKTIKGNGYSIIVKYGNIFKAKNCKKVISFDECFTTEIGEAPHQIKPTSICGQFLKKECSVNINSLIEQYNLKPLKTKSKYKNKDRYESGRILPYNDFFIMPFAKLDEYGSGVLTRDEYLSSLNTMWKEIDDNYASKNVCIPVLGSGITRFNDEPLSQQQLLDIIIASYKLNSHHIKHPSKLIIICKKNEDFSLNKIGEYI